MRPNITETKGTEDFHLHLRVDVFLVVRVNRSILKEGRCAMEVIVDALHKFARYRFQNILQTFM